MSFLIHCAALEQIEEQARQGFPYEVCGFLGGVVLGQGQKIRPARNIAAHRQAEYIISPEETLMSLLNFEGDGLKLTGVYHSHPRYPARPSGTDLALADLPGVFYLITSIYDQPGGHLQCETKVWKFIAGKALAADLNIL